MLSTYTDGLTTICLMEITSIHLQNSINEKSILQTPPQHTIHRKTKSYYDLTVTDASQPLFFLIPQAVEEKN